MLLAAQIPTFLDHRDVAQSGSAPALGAGGRRFKSGRPDQEYREPEHDKDADMTASIYRLAKTAMQFGLGNVWRWLDEPSRFRRLARIAFQAVGRGPLLASAMVTRTRSASQVSTGSISRPTLTTSVTIGSK